MIFTQVTISATIENPVSMVWAKWTKPAHITQWNFASDDWQCPNASNDLKVGGTYSARMEAKDGSFGFDLVGVYDEVEDQKKLTYTMCDGRKATTMFQTLGNATLVTTVFDAETENTIELQRSGWQSILNNFKKYAERT